MFCSCSAGRQWQPNRTRGRGRGNSGWIWISAQSTHGWLECWAIAAKRGRWCSVKRQRGHQRPHIGDMDGQSGGRATLRGHIWKLGVSWWSLNVVYKYLQSISRSKSQFYFALHKMGVDVLAQPSHQPRVRRSCDMCTFLDSLQTVLPQRCLTGVAPLLMKAFRGQWSESCRDPSGTLFIHLWIFCSSVVPLRPQAWTSDVAVVLMRTAQKFSSTYIHIGGDSPYRVIQV